MPRTAAQKLIADHLVDGSMEPGSEIGLAVDQTLTQDATGTMVMLELEAMDLDRIRTELSVQYVDLVTPAELESAAAEEPTTADAGAAESPSRTAPDAQPPAAGAPPRAPG